ncbi:MAG: hypothetical protein KJO01_10375 [Gammaproteobacteria bacterium]|nr:hypothetical protein [Gammaproteobacteria bacterium]MBT8111493.1 hypothetical protein [Gammaproteobacteria bacterium]NND47742.1 hypothetical protein [Woeseiaceae bacterium]NNL46191.1 hypothetical protein [Woeseiaceae bacterium]
MKNNNILAAAIVIAALVATVAHHMLKDRPIERLAVQEFFYEQSGLTINVPEDSFVEIYADFVLIVRADGLITMVPIHRLHAIDGRGI